MQAKLIDRQNRVYAVIFDTGEDPVAGLTRFAQNEKLDSASFTAIGAFSEATLGYFDWQSKDYEHIPVREQTEVLSLLGDVALGGLLAAKVRPTLEVVLDASPGCLERRHDPASGLALIKID